MLKLPSHADADLSAGMCLLSGVFRIRYKQLPLPAVFGAGPDADLLDQPGARVHCHG